MDNVNILTDQELRAALKKYNVTAGPITDSTRNLYRKKLASTIEENEPDLTPVSSQETVKSSPRAKSTAAAAPAQVIEEEDEEDTSDEEFYVREEDLEDEEEDDDEEFEDEEEEDVLSELQDDDLTLSRMNATGMGDLTTRSLAEPGASASRISVGILISLISFFVVIISYYLLSKNNLDLSSLRPFKSILLVLALFSPVTFIAYKTFRYYRTKSHEENKRVCKLVSEAIELLQSPDNPKGLMPVLHIRDTLLTPAERKSKQMSATWNKALKFIEEHESRIKVELVNIDGEDFRAWKWIGTRKL